MKGYARRCDNPDFYFQQNQNPRDTVPSFQRYGDPYANPNRNTFDFRDTGYIKRSIEYDPVTKQY